MVEGGEQSHTLRTSEELTVEKTSSIRLQLVILRLREEEEDIQNIIFR
jgi:hypothetical protein